MAFVGDAAMPGTTAFAGLRPALAPHTLLLPGHDPQDRFAWTLAQADGTPAPGAEGAEGADTPVALCREQLRRLPMPAPLLVDVREPCEHLLGGLPDLGLDAQPAVQSVPLSAFLNALPGWLALAADTPVLFYCRSGNRSGQAARALRRLGHPNAWSLEGGLAVWPVRWPSLSGPGGAPARRQAPRAERPAPGG
jgi:rhodanese-related sulfurtransferase